MNPVQKGHITLILLVIILGLLGGFYFFRVLNQSNESPQIQQQSPTQTYPFQSPQQPQSPQPPPPSLKTYQSEKLKLKFKHLSNWSVEEKFLEIKVNPNPKETAGLILIGYFNGCFDSIEQNLIDNTCGENVNPSTKGKIISKQSRQLSNSIYYKYVVKRNGTNIDYHLIQNNDEIIRVSKTDGLLLVTEFEEIINSIEFIN